MGRKKSITVFQKSRKYTNGIKIPFSEIFNDPNFKQYENFDLVKKRTYYNKYDFFIQENNKLMKFDKNNEIITNYLMVKHNIDKERYVSPEHFIQSLFPQILKPWFVEDVGYYVEERFKNECVDIDKSIHNQQGKYNPALVFTNFHAIILYKMACLMRFIAPLCTHFMYVYSDMLSNKSVDELKKDREDLVIDGVKIFDKNTFIMEIAITMLNLISIGYPDLNMYGKINNYIINVIKSSEYTNSEMWNKLVMHSVTKYNIADIILRKILVDIIPKSSFKKHIIKFIVVTIESQINWVFTTNFRINFNMVGGTQEDTDFSDTDKFEINSAKSNMQKKIFNDNFSADTINIIFERYNYVPNKKKLSWYYENNMNDIPSIQIYAIYNFFAKYFGGYNNLNGLDYVQWTRLLVFLLDYLETHHYKILQYVITGKIKTLNAKRVVNKTVERKLRESERYKRIMEKYSDTGVVLQESKNIEQHMMFMLNSTLEYNYYKYDKNGETIILDLAESSDELLRFIEEL